MEYQISWECAYHQEEHPIAVESYPAVPLDPPLVELPRLPEVVLTIRATWREHADDKYRTKGLSSHMAGVPQSQQRERSRFYR